MLLPMFFDPNTSTIMRAIIRGVIVAGFVSAYIEAGSRTCVTLVAKCGLSPTALHLTMVRPLMMMSVCGRIMQGSAQSFGESIFL